KREFAEFVKDAKYQTDAEKTADPATWQNPGFEQTVEHPVVCVTWHDAVMFCQWLSKKEGRVYDLPTEAQWEYACRAGTAMAYYFGNDPELLKEHAWYGDNSEKQTHPVGQLLPNPWKLYDMYGNVRQWCRDGLRTYTEGSVDDPRGPETADSHRGFRGGDWG